MQVHSQLSLVRGGRWAQLVLVEKSDECRLTRFQTQVATYRNRSDSLLRFSQNLIHVIYEFKLISRTVVLTAI